MLFCQECIKPRLNTRCPSNLPYTSSYDDFNVLMDQSCPPGFKPLKNQSRRRQSVNMTSETDPVHVDAVKKTKKKAVESRELVKHVVVDCSVFSNVDFIVR